MSNIESLLLPFSKGQQSEKKSFNKNAVIYTRVSSKEQADNNQSLETQKKYCLQYALKNDLNIMGFFGGTYESAKTDERNEFNRMIRFVKNQKEGVAMILVYSLDRFSRTGDNAIFISSELKKRGISIVSVTQPIDVSTHSGVLQQNIQFIFSKYDNDLRREKCIDGMREKLLKGEFLGRAPIGYEYDHTSKEQRIVVNRIGLLIKKGFELKANGYTNTDIALHLAKLGFRANRKRLSFIFNNPFYCGYVTHNFLEGKLVKGKHEALVSEELFLRANDVLKKNGFGYKHEQSNANIPLKNYVRCGSCGTPFTGYIVKKKNLYYYKCNKIGCKCNRSAKAMHQLYADFLKQYEVDKSLTSLLKEQLLLTYEHMTDSNESTKAICKKRLTELTNKLEALEERYAFGEINEEIFERISSKLKGEIASLQHELDKMKNKLSNPEKFIDQSLKICSNLSGLWVSADYNERIKLQELLFPEGIFYDRENGNYRTSKVNLILELTRSFTKDFREIKTGQSKSTFDLSRSVVRTGRNQ